MNKLLRGALFWTFITFFLIAAPVSVLYTAGYRYNAKNGSVVRTGVISISSTPRNAKINLNSESTERSTPYVFKRIIPGSYTISIEKDGFHSWSGDIKVESGATTTLQNILLYKTDEPALKVARTTSNVAPSPDGRSAAFTIEEGGWEEIWLFQSEENEPQLIDRVSNDLTVGKMLLIWSADGSKLLAQKPEDEIIRFYTKDGTELIVEERLLNDANHLFWHPENGNILYISTTDELRQYDFSTGVTEIFENDAVASVVINTGILTFINNGTNTELYQTTGNEKRIIALLPRSTYSVLERDGSFLLLKDSRENIILLDITASQPILFESQAHVYDWDENHNRLVVSDGIEVTIYSPSTHTTELITRQSEFIESIAWHADGSNILVGTKNHLTVVEAFKVAERRANIELASVDNMTTFWISKDGKIAFFYGTTNEETGFYTLELLR